METLATYSNRLGEVSLSPDGRVVAFGLVNANNDIHLYDLQRGITSRFTFEGGDKDSPVWTPDGKRIVYALLRADATTLVWKAIDSRAEPEQLLPPGNVRSPSSVSPDGKRLAYTEIDPTTGPHIWTLSLMGSPDPKPFLRTRFRETLAVFSTDGQWLAYDSNESGTAQVYAARFPDGSGKVQISTDGGEQPQWAANGRELFYRKGDAMMAVAVATQPVFTVGRPQVLFHAALGPRYAVARDGQHFYMGKDEEVEPRRQINVVLNWFEELKHRVPVR